MSRYGVDDLILTTEYAMRYNYTRGYRVESEGAGVEVIYANKGAEYWR